MRILKFDSVATGCLVLAVVFGHASAYGQLDHSKLMNEYQRQMQLLPPISVTTNFKSLITEDELSARYERHSQERLRPLFALSAEELELARIEFKLPPGENVTDVVVKQVKDSFATYQDDYRTGGVYEFFGGNHNEIRSFSPQGDIIRTLQFGLIQPKLRSTNSDTWVIKEFDDKHHEMSIRSESKVGLRGMLPVGAFRGAFHRSIDQRYSSGFDLFWESSPEIRFFGKSGDADVYLKQHPDKPETWLVACFEDPQKSIVPVWLVRAFTPGKNELDAKVLVPIIDVVAHLPRSESSLVPTGVYIQDVTLFDKRTKVGQFEGYPNAIRCLVPIDWNSTQEGFTNIAPFQDFLMQVTKVTVGPESRTAFAIEDGDSYHDYDRKIGWIIGDDPPLPSDRTWTRTVLWLTAILLVVIGIFYFYKRK